MASDAIERLHLKFLKWALGLHKKASNLFCWGDTGRCPVIQKIAKQSADYFNRLNSMSLDNVNSLARHSFSFEEQKSLNRRCSSKLEFYRQLKNEPNFESYLDIRNRDVRKSLAQLGSSSHRLNIETARFKLSDHIKFSILAWDERVPSLFEANTQEELSLYVHRIFQQRFPKQNK
ncbi:hypothetical protein ACHWQZ_G003583 [Mnemiopsis leidyi]